MRDLVNTVSRELSTDPVDAGRIVADILRCRPHELYLIEGITDGARNAVLSSLTELKNGMPLEYITGMVQFRDHVLRINAGVFIPRPETEYFVELIMKRMHKDPSRILEIGTGTGAISIALASSYPGARILATDISSRAIENARQNIRKCGLEQRVLLVRSDAYSGIRGSFDLIVSNPPYIPRSRIHHLPKSVKDFEPVLALDGGNLGTELTERLILGGLDRISNGGAMAFEIDEDAVDILRGFLTDHEISAFRFEKDLSGSYRYLFIGVPDEES
ncbi:MAG: peptide chain release factor N(5)-glutamine methyltransferase [candidate division WOR-3 bacterium]|nr:MAG: peptide chain release factor N(5)-glutamine methyltransferase [candidate division WOR-3 bacterium]